MRLLMCRPDYYGIHYEINPWMNIQHQVNSDLALEQWQHLYHTLTLCGATIQLIKPIPNWPDMVFTANAGLIHQGKVIISHFKFKERQGEARYFSDWFENNGFEKINLEKHNQFYFEGAGDALFAGKQLFVGFGMRSEKQFYNNLEISQDSLIRCELVHPYFYHLDTCFCPLNADLAIWYPQAFSLSSQAEMQQAIKLIAVEEKEAKRFACNAVVLGQHIILPSACPSISALLEQQGFTIHACDMSEFLKAGGACKCLTLQLD
jgi:N-dimethylarginine dimethylaminohydrolase